MSKFSLLPESSTVRTRVLVSEEDEPHPMGVEEALTRSRALSRGKTSRNLPPRKETTHGADLLTPISSLTSDRTVHTPSVPAGDVQQQPDLGVSSKQSSSASRRPRPRTAHQAWDRCVAVVTLVTSGYLVVTCANSRTYTQRSPPKTAKTCSTHARRCTRVRVQILPLATPSRPCHVKPSYGTGHFLRLQVRQQP